MPFFNAVFDPYTRNLSWNKLSVDMTTHSLCTDDLILTHSGSQSVLDTLRLSSDARTTAILSDHPSRSVVNTLAVRAGLPVLVRESARIM